MRESPEWGRESRDKGAEFRAGVLAGAREGLLDGGLLVLIAEAGANRTIDTELGALRLLLLRALAQESLTGDLDGTARTVARLTDAIGRALRVREALDDGGRSQLEAELNQMLHALGLGDEEAADEGLLGQPERGFATGFERE